jgi:hypothetical protein
MSLDLDDLRSVFDEAVAGHRDDPDLLLRLARRARRDTRRRRVSTVAAVAAAVAVLTVPLTMRGDGTGPVLEPSRDGRPAAPSRTQDPGPELDLRKGPEPAIGTLPTVDDEVDFPLPFDRYHPANASERRADWAVNRRARACLRRFGLDMPKANSRIPKGTPGAVLIGAYGVVDPARAAAHGYGFAPVPGDDGASMEPPEMRGFREMNETEASVFHGLVTAYGDKPVPEEGCLGEARRELGWSWAFYGEDVQRLPQVALEYALRDRRVKAINLRWHDCMRRAGFSYPDPQKAVRDPAWRNKTTPREIATAKADVACKRETGLLGTSLAVQIAYERQLIDRNSAALAPLKQGLAELESNVDAFIARREP